MTARLGSAEVVRTLWTHVAPVWGSIAARSVKVPPMSIPTLRLGIRALRLRSARDANPVQIACLVWSDQLEPEIVAYTLGRPLTGWQASSPARQMQLDLSAGVQRDDRRPAGEVLAIHRRPPALPASAAPDPGRRR